MRRSIRWMVLGGLLAASIGRGTPAPALVGRCTSPDGSLADTPCVDDGDCPDGHTCSVSARRPGTRPTGRTTGGRVDSTR